VSVVTAAAAAAMELSRTDRLWLMLSLSTTYFLTELVVGILSNSMALAADAFHMLSDVLAMGVGIVAIRAAASAAPTRDNTYGYQRAELLGALANSVFLLALCFTIVLDAIKRLVEPAPIKHPGVVLAVGLVGLVLNGGGLLIFMDFSSSGGHGHFHGGHAHSHSHGHAHAHGHDNGHGGYGAVGDVEAATNGGAADAASMAKAADRERTLNMKAVYLHVLGDALGSLVVVISALLVLTTSIPGEVLDPLASLIIVAVLLVTTVPLARQSASILINGVPSGVDVGALRRSIVAIPAVTAVHELHVWSLSDAKHIGTAHVTVDSLGTYMDTAAAVKEAFHIAGVHSTTIQPELLDGTGDGRAGQSSSSDDMPRAQDVLNPQCLVRCNSVACAELVCCDADAAVAASPR